MVVAGGAVVVVVEGTMVVVEGMVVDMIMGMVAVDGIAGKQWNVLDR